MLIVQHTSSKYVPSKRLAGNVAKVHQLDKRNLTFLENNNCGKLALNHYVHEEDHDVVVLNETKGKLPRTFKTITTQCVITNTAWVIQTQRHDANPSITAGRMLHVLGKNLELSSSASRMEKERTTVHLTDPYPIPATLGNSLNEFWQQNLQTPSLAQYYL